MMLKIKKHSGIYTLRSEQFLPVSLDAGWDFFSAPGNLSKITPTHMGFKMTSPSISKMYPGQIITYIVGLFPGIKSKWVTEITHVAEKKYFVDEQRFGPYKMWHHEHHFRETEKGIFMTDIVSYKLPFGMVGRLFHPVLVKPQLKRIFIYRSEVLKNIFG